MEELKSHTEENGTIQILITTKWTGEENLVFDETRCEHWSCGKEGVPGGLPSGSWDHKGRATRRGWAGSYWWGCYSQSDLLFVYGRNKEKPGWTWLGARIFGGKCQPPAKKNRIEKRCNEYDSKVTQKQSRRIYL